MRKENTLYLAAIFVLVAGLWGILIAGRSLRPPYALAGRWNPIENDTKAPAMPFVLFQSGRFFRIRFESGDDVDLRWKSESLDEGGTRCIQLQGDHQSIDVSVRAATRPAGSAEYRFQFQGKVNGTWRAFRQINDDRAVAGVQQRSH